MALYSSYIFVLTLFKSSVLWYGLQFKELNFVVNHSFDLFNCGLKESDGKCIADCRGLKRSYASGR